MDTSLLEEIYTWEENGATFEDILERLRLRCVPPGYTPTPWSSGMYGDISTNSCNRYLFQHSLYIERLEETYEDKLRSIVAQLEYSHQVSEYDRAGVPFRTYMYVLEVHPITGMEFHEREDDAHVLKVCGSKLIGMSYNLLLILFPVENCKFNAPRQQQRAKTGAFL